METKGIDDIYNLEYVKNHSKHVSYIIVVEGVEYWLIIVNLLK